MEKLESLYNIYLEAGLISAEVTLEQFANSNREQQAGLFDLGGQAGIFEDTSFDQFETAFVKKKGEDEPTDLSSGTGGSDSSADAMRNAGREYDTISRQIATLQNQVREEQEVPLTDEEEKRFPLGKPAIETPEMVKLDSLVNQRDRLLKSIDQRVKNAPPPPVVTKELEREKEMDIVDVALEFPDLDYNKLNATGRVKIDKMAAKYNQSPENFLFDVKTEKSKISSMSYMQKIGNDLAAGDKSLGEMLVSVPGTIYSMANVVGSRINKELGMLGIDIKDNITEEQFEQMIGTGPLLKKLVEEQEYRRKKGDIWNQSEGIEGGVTDNFSDGNFSDGFKQLGSMLAESAPVTIGIMMASFSGLGIGQIARGGTVAMAGPELRQQRENNPEQTEAMSVFKALGLGGAEMVFSAISSGSLAKVYKEIIFKEGVKKGAQTFQKGIVSMYQEALKKYGASAAMVGEGVEEVATQMTQNLINGRPALEGVPDAFTVGVAGGALYGSPISINNNIIQPLNEAVSRTKINTVLESSEFNNITEAFQNPTIGDLQFDLSKVKRSGEILDKDLKRRVKDGEMTQEEATKIKQNFFEASIIDVKLDARNLTGETKVQAANLIKERSRLQETIDEVDDASLTSVEQERIAEIDLELTSLSTITVTESVAGDTPSINVAPLFDTTIETVEQAVELRQGEKYQQQMQTINDVLGDFGVTGTIEEAIGGYKNDSGTEIIEISNVIKLGEGTTREQADQIASMLGALAPETQESTIAADYVDQNDSTKNGEEYLLNVSDIQGTLSALKEAGITDFTLNEQNNSLSLLNLDFMDSEVFQDKLNNLLDILDEKQIKFSTEDARSINSRYINVKTRGEILRTLQGRSVEQQLEGTSLYQKVEQAIARDSETTTEETIEDDTTTDEVVEETIETPQDQVQLLIDTINDPSAGIEETVEVGREEGFTDAQIQKVLQGRGFKVKDIKPVLERARTAVQETMGVPLPAAFANIPGGIKVGQALFEEIKQELNKFEVKFSPDRKTVNEVVTKGQIREKALELLRASEVYQNLETIEQQELELALDRSIGTRANRKVQQEIKTIRESIKKYKEGVKNLKKAQAQVTKFIKEVLPNEKDIKRFVNSINKVTSKQDLPAVAEKIIKDVQAIREKQKQKLIKDIQTLARKKAKIRKTRSNKSRGGDISAQGKQFFQEVNRVLNTVFKGSIEEFDAMTRELSYITKRNKNGQVETIDSGARINELTLKELAGEKLTQEESSFLDRMTAIELFADIEGKSLEEVQDLLNDLKLARSQAIADLNKRKELKALRAKKTSEEATEQVNDEFPFMFTEEGDLLSQTQLTNKKRQTSIWKLFDGKGVWKNLREVANKFRIYTAPGFTRMLSENLYHLGTIAYTLDGNKEGFFTKNFYTKLNLAEEKALRGKFDQEKKMNEIASSIDGVKNFASLKKLFGFKQIEIKTSEGTFSLSKDNLARIYALSQNEIQAEMLAKDGFDAKKIEEIKKILGKEIVEFVDKTVVYLSTENYEGVNDVYREVNDINLPRIENYFPTKTIRDTDGNEFISNLNRGEFSNLFNAETAPLLVRSNTKGNVNLEPQETFLNTLSGHLETTERYKAYAKEVENLNNIMKTPSVQRLLKDGLTTDALVRQLINYAINPYAGAENLGKKTTWFLSGYTGVALSLKAIQFLKQSTSFVNAFKKYRTLPGEGKRAPYETFIDHVAFAADMAFVLSTAPYQVYQSYNMSAGFRDRLNKGIGGDLMGLEAGGRSGRSFVKRGQVLWRAIKAIFSTPTVFGDTMGVLGYKAAYNADIRRGVSEEKALERFNDYNATQQTRRGTEKNSLQNSPEMLTRGYTMFLSTTFLQINETMQGMGGIMRSLSPYDGKNFSLKNMERPTATNLRSVTTSAFIANAFFTFTANIAKYAFGGEEDKEEVIERVMLSPLSLLYAIPLMGSAAEILINQSFLENKNIRVKDIVNPYTEMTRKAYKYAKDIDEKETFYKKNIEPVLKAMTEIYFGVSASPIEGAAKTVSDFFEGKSLGFGGGRDEVDPDDLYDAVGISPYYRPNPKPKSSFEMPKTGGKGFNFENKMEEDFKDKQKTFKDKFKSKYFD